MVDHNPVYLAEREDGEFLGSECRLEEESIRRFHDLVLLPRNQGVPPGNLAEQGLLDVTHIGNCHISRKVRDLRRIALLQLLKLLGGPGDKDDFVRRRQEGLGDRKADTAACAGDNDHLRFHLLAGDAGPSSKGGVLARSWCMVAEQFQFLSFPIREFQVPLHVGSGEEIIVNPRACLSLSPYRSLSRCRVPIEPVRADVYEVGGGQLRGIILCSPYISLLFLIFQSTLTLCPSCSSSLISNVVPSFSIHA